jgi:probable rRNA maturation factor
MITLEPPGKPAAPPHSLSKAGLARFLNRVRHAVGLDGEVHVLLAGDATLRRLNRRFLGHDKPTDVLSFPAGATTVFFGDPGEPELAGDLAISLETAARQAARQGHSLQDEVRVLLLHGALHLAGFDHETDAGEMAAREADLRQELGLPNGLIARARTKVTTKNRIERRQGAGTLRSAQNGKSAKSGKPPRKRVRA